MADASDDPTRTPPAPIAIVQPASINTDVEVQTPSGQVADGETIINQWMDDTKKVAFAAAANLKAYVTKKLGELEDKPKAYVLRAMQSSGMTSREDHYQIKVDDIGVSIELPTYPINYIDKAAAFLEAALPPSSGMLVERNYAKNKVQIFGSKEKLVQKAAELCQSVGERPKTPAEMGAARNFDSD